MLYIVATPIGNLDDITFRAVEILKTVDLILAEDTRHSRYLLDYYQINTKMRAFHEHNETQKVTDIIKHLHNGQTLALISDAGTPLISDPGYVLVREAKKAGIQVVPIPGASALISALSASGLASNQFGFFGFLSAKPAMRLKTLQTLKYQQQTSIFYESPKRIVATLKDCLACFGEHRLVCIAKEISKTFETIKTAPLPELIAYLEADKVRQKGEFVLLISGADKKLMADERELNQVLSVLLTEMGAAKAAKLAAKITGFDKPFCYQRAIDL